MVNNGQQWSQFLENQNLVGEDNDDPGVELGGEVSMWQKKNNNTKVNVNNNKFHQGQ